MAWYNPFSWGKESEVVTSTTTTTPIQSTTSVHYTDDTSETITKEVSPSVTYSGGGRGSSSPTPTPTPTPVTISGGSPEPVDASFTTGGSTYKSETGATVQIQPPDTRANTIKQLTTAPTTALTPYLAGRSSQSQRTDGRKPGMRPDPPKEIGLPTVTPEEEAKYGLRDSTKPYWTFTSTDTKEAVEEGKVAGSVNLVKSPIGFETTGTYDTNWANIIMAQKVYGAGRDYRQEVAGVSAKFQADPTSFKGTAGFTETKTDTETTYNLGEEYLSSLPATIRYRSMFDESGYLKPDLYTESLKEAKERRTTPISSSFWDRAMTSSKNVKLASGEVLLFAPKTAVGLTEFGITIAGAGAIQTSKDGKFTSPGFFSFAKSMPDSFAGRVSATPYSPSASGFKFTSPSTYGKFGSYIKELPSRPGTALQTGLIAGVGYTAVKGAVGTYGAERVAGATRWGATGTVVTEGLSTFTPIKIQPGVIGTSFKKGMPGQVGTGKVDFLKLGTGKEVVSTTTGAKIVSVDKYIASGSAKYSTPTEFTYGSVKYGWGGITPKITTITATDYQVVALGTNLFDVKAYGMKGATSGKGLRNIATYESVPIQTSRYGFELKPQTTFATQTFRGTGTGVAGKSGLTFSEGTFYFTPKGTFSYSPAYTTTTGKIIPTTSGYTSDAPILKMSEGISLGKTYQPYTRGDYTITPGKSVSFLKTDDMGIYVRADTKTIIKGETAGTGEGSGEFFNYGGGRGSGGRSSGGGSGGGTILDAPKTITGTGLKGVSKVVVTPVISSSAPPVTISKVGTTSLLGLGSGSITKTGLATKTSLASAVAPATMLAVKPAVVPVVSSKVTPITKTALSTATTQVVVPAITPAFVPALTTGIVPAITPAVTPTFFPGWFGLPPGGLMGGKTKSKKFRGKQRFKYTPDFPSLALGITGKAPKGLATGLKSRPIPKGFSFAYSMPSFSIGNLFRTKLKRRKK